jgi:hypothetical protein
VTCGNHSVSSMETSDASKLRHSRSFHFGSFTTSKHPKSRRSKSQSAHESSDLKNTSKVFLTVDKIQWKDSVSGSVNRKKKGLHCFMTYSVGDHSGENWSSDYPNPWIPKINVNHSLTCRLSHDCRFVWNLWKSQDHPTNGRTNVEWPIYFGGI